MYMKNDHMKKLKKKGYPKQNSGMAEGSLSDEGEDYEEPEEADKNSYADYDPQGLHNPYHMGKDQKKPEDEEDY
jgi:hypothetical protein